MTNDCAVVIIDNEKPGRRRRITFTKEEKCEAFEMAIAALQAKPCEDAVSREHLLSEIDALMQSPWFNNGKDDDRFTHYGYVERKEAVEVVRDLCVKAEPSVTPKQRTGKWRSYFDEGFVECPFCGSATNCDDNAEELRFCWNCGAKMEGVSE